MYNKINPCTCGEMPKEMHYSGQDAWEQTHQIKCPECNRCLYVTRDYTSTDRHKKHVAETVEMWNNGVTGGYRQNCFGNLEEDKY